MCNPYRDRHHKKSDQHGSGQPQQKAQPMPSSTESVLRQVLSQVQSLNQKVDHMSQEVQDLKALVTKVVADVNAKLAALLAASTGLSDEDKAAISEMTASLSALDAQVNPAPAPAAA